LQAKEVDMPDGDRVHKGLGWKYQKAYKQICDGQFGGKVLAEEVVPAVWKDIQRAGDVPIELLREVAAQCQQIIDRRMFEQIDWQKELKRIDDLAQPMYADRRLKTLAVEACKEQLQDLRNGENPSNCHIELLTKYMWNVYVAQFSERVPLPPSHYKGVSREFVSGRLEVMRPHVKEQLLPYVESVYRHNTVHLARRPYQRSKEKPDYNIDTDISTVGA
jgi:hypothetical protein